MATISPSSPSFLKTGEFSGLRLPQSGFVVLHRFQDGPQLLCLILTNKLRRGVAQGGTDSFLALSLVSHGLLSPFRLPRGSTPGGDNALLYPQRVLSKEGEGYGVHSVCYAISSGTQPYLPLTSMSSHIGCYSEWLITPPLLKEF